MQDNNNQSVLVWPPHHNDVDVDDDRDNDDNDKQQMTATTTNDCNSEWKNDGNR